MKKQTPIALAAALLLCGVTAASAAGIAAASGASPSPTTDKAAPSSIGRAASDTLSLTGAQQKTAWKDLYMGSMNQKTPENFSAKVGAVMPKSITTAPVTTKAADAVPALKPYSFALVQKKLVIVNPSDRKIAEVITG